MTGSKFNQVHIIEMRMRGGESATSGFSWSYLIIDRLPKIHADANSTFPRILDEHTNIAETSTNNNGVTNNNEAANKTTATNNREGVNNE